MAYKALVFGAIGVMAETSELQREAYNLAFQQSGLNWEWDAEHYLQLLHRPGGLQRIIDYAATTGTRLIDPEEVHARKVANFRAAVLRAPLTLRPGIAEMIAVAEEESIPMAWATTTGLQTLELMFAGFAGQIRPEQFAYIGDRTHVEEPKPAPDIYLRTIVELGIDPRDMLAIEDTPESAEAALGAGLDVLAYPGKAAEGRLFPPGARVVSRVGPEMLLEALAA